MTPRQLQLRDEILQVLFWLKGENLGDAAGASDLAVWIATKADELEPVLWLMETDNLLVAQGDSQSYSLTPAGLAEGGRRFTEDFADAGLGAQGHGECSDGCDCQTLGPEACHQHHQGCEH